MSALADVARMLVLVPWLLERPGASISEIAQAFGASTDAIRRDLGRLDFCGLPGLGGGDLIEVHLVGDRVVLRLADELRRPLRLTPPEALRILLAAESALSAVGDELPALADGLAKLRRAAGVPEGSVAIARDDARWLPELRQALATGHQVELRYRGRLDDEPRSRRVDPWGLELHGSRWYLHARDVESDAGRVFRLDRIVGITPTAQPVASQPPSELPAPRYEPTGDEIEVQLRATGSGRWIAEALEDAVVTEAADGTIMLTVRTDAPDLLIRLVAAAAGEVGIDAPSTLRDLLWSRAKAGLATYQN